ncbi:hypothetical protein ACWGPT_18460 [Pseudorhizobium sp. NPDC055634]
MSEQAHLAIVALAPSDDKAPVVTKDLFREPASQGSPIDNFIAHTNAINKLLAKIEGEPEPEVCSVVLLGYLSAVETYFRTLLSRLAHTDVVTGQMLGDKPLTYAVAISRPRESLAEALYEDSFASSKELSKRLGEIGFKIPQSMDQDLKEYDNICHLRHCCVHRFGYLGTKNAYELGIREHRQLIGHVFSATLPELDNIADSLQQFVKQCNNHLYKFVVDRTIDFQNRHDNPFDWSWTWQWKADKRRFTPYYDLFALQNTKPSTPPVKEVYEAFRTMNAKKVKAMSARKGKQGSDAQ